ncbi:MAG: PASTA domain-containing protein [Oscillospiraceae bacterium]|nr:PASTA domain-containing protein [Oscillospiraceae bacterium]
MPNNDLKLCMGCMEPVQTEDSVCPLCGYSADNASSPSYLPPKTILCNRYIVGRLLRYNGESAEYIGYDMGTSSKVIIREYMPDTLCSRTKDSPVISVRANCVAQYKAFMAEFVELNKTLAKMRTLSHINPPIDMFGENNTGYVIFRYIEGINLGKYLKEHAGELSWDEVREMFPPIFTTLSLIHNAGLIHRGISPDNIIVGENGTLKLIGFCIADVRTANTKLASEIYSGFAAPEQYSSSNWQGTWTDVYGVSALLYRTLTGTTPTDAMERANDDTLPEPRALNSSIPPNVSKVIMHGMAIPGEMRIQTVTEFVTELFEEPEYNKKPQTSHTVTIPKQKKEHSAPKKNNKHKVFWIALISSAVVMVVLMTVLINALDDNSSNVLMGITTTTPVLTERETEDSFPSADTDPSETEAPRESTVSSMPTLAVVESSEESESGTTRAVRNGATVYTMNDLTGKTLDMIKNTAVMDNLNIIPDYIYTDEYTRGMIFKQSIEKGSSYEKGADCVLSISMGPGTAIIPEYTGLNKKDYFDLLNKKGIKYEEKAYETEDVLNGYVAWLNMEPGTEINIEEGEVLEVYIASNNRTEATTVSTTIVTIPTEEIETAWITTTAPVIVTVETTTETASASEEDDPGEGDLEIISEFYE